MLRLGVALPGARPLSCRSRWPGPTLPVGSHSPRPTTGWGLALRVAAHSPVSFTRRRFHGRSISRAGSGALRHQGTWGAGSAAAHAPGRCAPTTRARSTARGREAARGWGEAWGLRDVAGRASDAWGGWRRSPAAVPPWVVTVRCAGPVGVWLWAGSGASAAGGATGAAVPRSAAAVWSLRSGGLLGTCGSRPARHSHGAPATRLTTSPKPTPQTRARGHRRRRVRGGAAVCGWRQCRSPRDGITASPRAVRRPQKPWPARGARGL